MTETKIEIDVADELREAADKLRAKPERALDVPLADWLDQTARYASSDIEPDPDDAAPVHNDDLCGGVVGTDCACFKTPLAVARAINGAEHGGEVSAR